MTYIVIIEKNGDVKNLNFKKYSEAELYKKASYRSSDGFDVLHTWTNVQTKSKLYENIILYGKKKGSAQKENKFDLPPPYDASLLFGNLIITYQNKDQEICDLKTREWHSIYETLMGGFEDLQESESESESEAEDIHPSMLEKNGYLKDDFVVDDEEEEYGSELSEEDYFESFNCV